MPSKATQHDRISSQQYVDVDDGISKDIMVVHRTKQNAQMHKTNKCKNQQSVCARESEIQLSSSQSVINHIKDIEYAKIESNVVEVSMS